MSAEDDYTDRKTTDAEESAEEAASSKVRDLSEIARDILVERGLGEDGLVVVLTINSAMSYTIGSSSDNFQLHKMLATTFLSLVQIQEHQMEIERLSMGLGLQAPV